MDHVKALIATLRKYGRTLTVEAAMTFVRVYMMASRVQMAIIQHSLNEGNRDSVLNMAPSGRQLICRPEKFHKQGDDSFV